MEAVSTTKETTFNGKTTPISFAKQYKHLTALEWEDFLFSDQCPKYLFQLPNPKNDVVWGSQESQVPPAYQVKGSSKWLIWGGMTGPGLTNLHFIPQGQTVTADYYISQILEKEVKPLLNRRSTTEIPVMRRLFSLNQKMALLQDGAPAHSAKSTQNWCKRNLPNLIEKPDWPANSQILTRLKISGELWMRIRTEIRNRKPWHNLRGAFPKHGLISP